jgi:hypothetical protein
MKNKKIEIARLSLVGVQYPAYPLVVGTIKTGSKLKLYWEKNNAFDSMAIRVEYNGVKIGYIPKGEFQDLLHNYRENGIKVYSSITAHNKTNPTWYMFCIKCEVNRKLNNSRDGEPSFD